MVKDGDDGGQEQDRVAQPTLGWRAPGAAETRVMIDARLGASTVATELG